MSFVGISQLVHEFKKATQFFENKQIDYITHLVDEQKKKLFFYFLNENNSSPETVSIFNKHTTGYIISKVLPFVAQQLNSDEISLYLDKLDKVFQKEETHFKDKVHFFLPLLNQSNLKTEHINKMVKYLVATPYDIKDKALSSASSIAQYAALFFSHPLFSCVNNAKNVAGLYYDMVNNLFNSERKYQFSYIDSHNRAMPIKNSNFELFFKEYPKQTQHVMDHMQMDKLLFDAFLVSNVEYIEKSHLNHFNSLTYLVKKAEDKFPFNQFISYYLKHSVKLINEQDLHHKTPIQYAKKGVFTYHKKPSYQTLVHFGAAPIHNYFVECIQHFAHLFKKEEKKDILHYQDEKKIKESDSLEQQIHNIITNSIQKLYVLGIDNVELLTQSIKNISAHSLNILNKHQNNFNDNYLFVKEVIFNYLPNFTNEFVHIYQANPKKEFLEEYCLQLQLLEEKVIEKQNLLDNITDEIQLQSMKKNTQFLKAKQ